MTWNYRVVRYSSEGKTPKGLEFDEVRYSVQEVYEPQGLSADADAPCGDDQGQLLADFTAQARALTMPVLEWVDGVGFAEVEPPLLDDVRITVRRLNNEPMA